MSATLQKESLKVGEVLKRKRLEKNLSLKEIENATSIRAHFLLAIEEGHFGKLISPIYAQGFIKKYAAFLEVDISTLLTDSAPLFQSTDEEHSAKQEFTLGLGSFEVRGSPGGEVKWLPNLMWVGLSVLALLVLWFGGRTLGLL